MKPGPSKQDLSRERDRLRLLLEVNNAVASNLDLHDLLQAISNVLRECVPHDYTGLAIYEQRTGKLRIHSVEATDKNGMPLEGESIPMEGTTAGLALTTRKTVLRDRIDLTEFHAPVFKNMIDALGIKSACVVPLILEGRALGVISLMSRTEAAFSEKDAEMLSHIATQLALAVDNALHYHEIETLKNRLASEKLYLEEEIQTQYNFEEIIGQSAALKKILQQVATVAPD